GVLMLLLAHLIKLNKEWRSHEISVLCKVPPQTDRNNLHEKMQGILNLARVSARVVIVDESEDALGCCAGHSGLTILPMPRPAGKPVEYVQALSEQVEGLGDVLLIASAGDVTIDS
ncbi:MAG: hypothetical protein Q7I92_01920, partial [Humidesulfovibrio sp.]|nr:hypothetical protein [Humidesulfovibrio sp.]